ncbi:MAG: tetratricopeptide repeat protein [Paucibacter sp.]|nr:tetratricopeptide repeat protein [Roseateles sp.]
MAILIAVLCMYGWIPTFAQQTASATGPCGVAINASGQSHVVVTNYCDIKTAAAVQLLLDRAAKQEDRMRRMELDQARERDRQARQIAELTAAVKGIQQRASAAGATPADLRTQELLSQGDSSGAAELLGQKAANAQANSSELYRQQAALLRVTDIRAALTAYERSLVLEPGHLYALWEAGDLAVALGDLKRAEAHFAQMLKVAKAQQKAQPQAADAIRWVSISLSRLGDVQLARGDFTEALSSYRADLETSERLAAIVPGSRVVKRELGRSHCKLGDVEREMGRLTNPAL